MVEQRLPAKAYIALSPNRHLIIAGAVTASRTPPSSGLHLREAAIHEQFDSRDVACIIGGEKDDCLCDLIG
jgi:hypothetical protein